MTANINMSSFFVFLLMACATVSVNGDCFSSLESIFEAILAAEMTVLEAVKAKCREQKLPQAEEEKCWHEKYGLAWGQCKTENADANDEKIHICLQKKLNVVVPSLEESREEFKNRLIALADESKKKEVHDILESCKDTEKGFYTCCHNKLAAGPCPELNEKKE